MSATTYFEKLDALATELGTMDKVKLAILEVQRGRGFTVNRREAAEILYEEVCDATVHGAGGGSEGADE